MRSKVAGLGPHSIWRWPRVRAVMSQMEKAISRTRLRRVACAYAAVLAFSAALIFERCLAYVRHPDDVAASGVCGLAETCSWKSSLAACFWKLRFPRAGDRQCRGGLHDLLQNPDCAQRDISGVDWFHGNSCIGQSDSILGYVCLFRALGSPMVLLGLAMSRLFARFPKPTRMTNYALLIEGATLFFMALMLFLPIHFHST